MGCYTQIITAWKSSGFLSLPVESWADFHWHHTAFGFDFLHFCADQGAFFPTREPQVGGTIVTQEHITALSPTTWHLQALLYEATCGTAQQSLAHKPGQKGAPGSRCLVLKTKWKARVNTSVLLTFYLSAEANVPEAGKGEGREEEE